MRYEQVVKKMPQALMELIAEQKWCSSLVAQGVLLPELLTNREYLAELHKHLSADEKRTLRCIVSTFGCQPFTRDALEKQAVLQMAGAQVASGLVGLRRAGVIAAFRKTWGEQLFVLPEEAFAAWQLLLYPSIKLRMSHEDLVLPEDENEGHSDSGDLAAPVNPRGMAQQLFHFLIACYRQPSLPLTNKGTLHKKQLLKLTEHLALPKDILHSAGLTYAFSDVYDGSAALALEMAIRMGFLGLNSKGDHYLFNEQACQTWLQGSYDKQQGQLYRIWRQLMLPAPVILEHGISLMERVEHGQWCDVNGIVKEIWSCCSYGGPLIDESSLRQEIMTAWLIPLSVFRFIELGTDKNKQLWFRWLIAPLQAGFLVKEDDHHVAEHSANEHPSLYVQPDFEVLLTPDTTLRTEWDIAGFADLQTTDLVRTYRLTKDSFHRAWEKGLDSDEMIRILQQNAYYEVPPHVTITLKQWGEQAGKLYFEDVTLLRCQSEDMADALLRNEKCLPFLGGRIGAADFIVSHDQLNLLTKCLENMGFDPKSSRKVEKGAVSESMSSPGQQAGGLCYSRDTIQLYEMDPHLPVHDTLYPDMQDIPLSWLKEFRAYHHSTRKEMIRKAIEWKSGLQLRKEGRNRFIIPRILREEQSGWILEGLEEYQEISLPCEDWEEMKLILPGINDAGVYP